MQPNAELHNPDPEYLRVLVERTGLSQQAVARRLGISPRLVRYYLAPPGPDSRPAPYTVQFALERLAAYC